MSPAKMPVSSARPYLVTHPGDHPKYKELLEILLCFERHGVVVTPVDTCIGVLAPAKDPIAVELVRTLLGRMDPTDPLPVTVGGVRAAGDLLHLKEMHAGFIAEVWPGAVLNIASFRRKAREIVDVVNPKGNTLGVRVTSDNVESALSREISMPVVSPAVRYRSGAPVRDCADAYKIISSVMAKNNISPGRVMFMARKEEEYRFSTQSTVVRLMEDDRLVEVIREGVYSRAEIDEIVGRVTFRSLALQVIAPLKPTPGRPKPYSADNLGDAT